MIGDRLLAIARAWFDAATVARVFEPLVADWQHECGGLSGVRALACRLCGYSAFARTFLSTYARDLLRPLPPGLGGATFVCIETFGAGAVLLLAFAYQAAFGGPGQPLMASLRPAELAAIPLALAGAAIVLLTRSRWPVVDVRRALIRFAPLYLAEAWFTVSLAMPDAGLPRRALVALLPAVALAIVLMTADRRPNVMASE